MFRELPTGSVNEQHATVQFLQDALRKQLAKLEIREERLIDLAADDALPKPRPEGRLNKIAMDRNRIQAGLQRTGEELKAGYDLLLTSLDLNREPAALYRRVPDEIRRLVNETLNERFYVDERGEVAQALRKPPFDISQKLSTLGGASQETKAGAEKQRTPASPKAQNVNYGRDLPLSVDHFWSMFQVRPNWSSLWDGIRTCRTR